MNLAVKIKDTQIFQKGHVYCNTTLSTFLLFFFQRKDCLQILKECGNRSSHLATLSPEEVCNEFSPRDEHVPCISLQDYLGMYTSYQGTLHANIKMLRFLLTIFGGGCPERPQTVFSLKVDFFSRLLGPVFDVNSGHLTN